MDLEGASALVTGGASGIGEACARALADHGAKVVIIDLNAERGAQIASEIEGAFAEADVADEAAVTAAVGTAVGLGPLRALVNAAGTGPPARIVDREGEPMPLAHFERIVRINLIGSFNVARLAAAQMIKTEPTDEHGQRGSIVNIASVAAFDGQIGQASYSASKGGIVGMTLPLARDLSTKGVRVNTIAPGLIDTPIFAGVEELKQRLAGDVLFPKRLGRPDEIVQVALMLLTNDYMNGEVIRVDGGIRMPPRSG